MNNALIRQTTRSADIEPHIPCIGIAQPPLSIFIQKIDYQRIMQPARSWWPFRKLVPG
jgi:hypothetical protein